MEVHKIHTIGGGMEIDRMRKSKMVEILKKEAKTNDDLNFTDHYVTTYLPELSKMLKAKFPKEGYEKIYSSLVYDKKVVDDVIFDHENYDQRILFVLSGKLSFNGIKKSEEDESIVKKDSIEFYNKQAMIHPDNLKLDDNLQFGKYTEYNCTCAEDSEVISVDLAFYDKTVKDYEDQAKNSKIKTLSKVFARFKKLDRSSKENFLKYFREEKFVKGQVIVNNKSKIEEIYTVEKGKVALLQKNDYNPEYKNGYVIFGVLEKETAFNEYPLVLEKENPYIVICVEEVQALVLDKSNYGFVADNDTSNDLRANSSCKERLQKLFLEKFSKMTAEEANTNQKNFLKKLGIEYKEIEAIFSKGNPANTKSNQYLKNLEKFNSVIGKPTTASATDPKMKFSEFATPRLVSKDPKFAALDPQRQLSLLALRNEGAMRRGGNTTATTTSILKNPEQLKSVQKNLLNEERGGIEKLMNRKTVSETKGITGEEENKAAAAPTAGGSLMNKFKRDNDSLLNKFAPNKESSESTTATEGQEAAKPEKKDGETSEQSQVKFDKKVEDGDKMGLEMAKKNLIAKKRSNLLSNPGML